MLPLSEPHGLIKGVHSAGCRVCATQPSEGVGWKLGTCDYRNPDRAPFLPNRKGKTEPGPLPPVGTGKICNSRRLVFFFSRSKIVRPGAETRPETDPERSQKANTNS